MRLMAWGGAHLRRTPLARSELLNRLYAGLAVRMHDSNEARMGEFRIRFDRRDRVLAKKLVLFGGYERHEIALLTSFVKPGDAVLDVGANIGIYTLHLSRAVGPTGRVISVEPDPDNLRLLRENIEINGCRNVTIVPCALGDIDRSAELFQVEDNRGYLSFADLAGTGRSISVPVRRGDEVLAEVGCKPEILKIDVEGAEPSVLGGLGYHPRVILFEFVPSQLTAQGFDPVSFLERLAASGYTLELLNPDTGGRTRGTPASITQGVLESGWDANLLAVR